MKTGLSILLAWALALNAFADPMTITLGSLQSAPRADATTDLVDWWLVTPRNGTVINVFGYSTTQQYVQLFDTASTNGPLIYVSGFSNASSMEWFTNSVAASPGGGEVSFGERIQLTNNFGAAAGIYYAVTTNVAGVFRLATTLANAKAGTCVDLTNNSSAGVLMRVPFHSMAVGAADNYSMIIPSSGWQVGKGLVAAVSSTAATYTAGTKSVTIFVTYQSQ